jgi:hypothetical protein
MILFFVAFLSIIVMLRKFTLFGLLLLSFAYASAQEFPWQGGRRAISASGHVAPIINVVRIGAPGLANGPTQVSLYATTSGARLQLNAYCQNEEIVLSIPSHVENGVYLYRVQSQAMRSEGKLVVQR